MKDNKKSLIKRMKVLNTHSRLKLKKHKIIEKLYGYLSIVSPVPRKKRIDTRIILYYSAKRLLFLPTKFENRFWKGEVSINGKILNVDTMKSDYNGIFNIQELKNMTEVLQIEVNKIIEEKKKQYINKFENEVKDFVTRRDY